MKQLLALILALSLTASLQAALPYLYGTTSQPGEETRFGGFEKGDFIYHTNDIVIPGRLGLDLVVGRTYHSAYTKAGVLGLTNEGNNIRIDDSDYGPWYSFRDGGWIGQGWSNTVGGYLLRSRNSVREGHTYGWASDPYSALSYRNYSDSIQIIVGKESYRFERTSDNGPWINSVVGARETLRTDNETYIFTTPDGTQYKFNEPFLNQIFTTHSRRDTGWFGWNKEGKKFDNTTAAIMLTSIKNQVGDQLIYTYQHTSKEIDGSFETDLKNRSAYGSIALGSVSQSDKTTVNPGSIGGAIGAAIGGTFGPVGGIIGNIIGATLEAAVYWDNSWGHLWMDRKLHPMRLGTVSDSLGRTVQFGYSQPVGTYTSIDDFLAASSEPYMIKTVSYPGVGGLPQTIVYDYYTDQLKGLLKSVTYPSGEVANYTYVTTSTIPGAPTNSYILSTVQDHRNLVTNVSYRWNQSSDPLASKFVVTSTSERDGLSPLSPSTTRYFSYSATDNYTPYRNGTMAFGFAQQTIRDGRNGSTIRNFKNGLPLSTISPDQVEARYIWDTNRRLQSITREEMTTSYQYDDYGSPTIVSMSEQDSAGASRRIYTMQTDYLHSNPAYQGLINQNRLNLPSRISYTDQSSDGLTGSDTYNYPPMGTALLLPTSKTTVDTAWIITTTNTLQNQKKLLSQTRIETYLYDPSGNMTQKSINGTSVQFGYQGKWYKNKVTYSDIGVGREIQYDLSTGLPIEVITFGNRTQLRYLPDGRLSQRILNIGTDKEVREDYTYNSGTRTQTQAVSWGQTTVTQFGTNGQKLSEKTTPERPGFTTLTTWTYGPENDLSSKTVTQTDSQGKASSRTMSWAYDNAGRLIQERYPDGSFYGYQYSNTALVSDLIYRDRVYSTLPSFWTKPTIPARTTTITDRNGSAFLIHQFGLNNRFRMVAGPAGIRQVSVADASGRPIANRDSDGAETHYFYSAYGDLMSMYDPRFEMIKSYKYDGAGNLSEMTDSNGGVISLSGYTTLGQYQTKTVGDEVYRYTYNDPNTGGLGKLSSVVGPGSAAKFEYDGAGHRILDRLTGPSYQVDVRYTYDLGGNLTGVGDPKGQTLYHYDGSNRLIGMSRSGKSIANFTYDGSQGGQLTETQFGTGIFKVNHAYTASDRLQSLQIHGTAPIIQFTQLTYDPEGNMATGTFQGTNGAIPLTMGYDTDYRLTRMSAPGLTIVSTNYSSSTERHETLLQSASFRLTNGQLKSGIINGLAMAVSYDKTGQITGKSTSQNTAMLRQMTFQFNPAGHLIQTTNRSSGTTINPIVVQYRYNDDGKRVAKIKNNSVTKQWAWGPWETPLLEMDAVGMIKVVNLLAPSGEKVGELRNTDSGWTTEYWIHDIFGNLAVRGDEQGRVLQKEFKLPFGDGYFDGAAIKKSALKPEAMSGQVRLSQPWTGGGTISGQTIVLAPGFSARATVNGGIRIIAPSANRRATLTGKDWDPDTGMYYFNARWYDPQLRRFISPDPVPMDTQGMDLYSQYAFVRFNPLRFVDPDGRKDYIYTDPSHYTTENDWGKLEFMNQDRYFAEIDGQRYLANSKETLTQEKLDWNRVETNWFSSTLSNGLKGASSSPEWVYRNSHEKEPFDFKRKLEHGALYMLDGKVYNIPEAGNVLWGAAMASLGYPYSALWAGAQFYMIKTHGMLDQANEVRSFTDGYNHINRIYSRGYQNAKIGK